MLCYRSISHLREHIVQHKYKCKYEYKHHVHWLHKMHVSCQVFLCMECTEHNYGGDDDADIYLIRGASLIPSLQVSKKNNSFLASLV